MPLVRPPLIELRQYVIAPGKRDRMIELFDQYFVDAQNALGLPILGTFRVVGDLDRLVWLRGFTDMNSRPERLGAFYGGSVWEAFGAEAITLVTGYDNVQLLWEAVPGAGIAVDVQARSALGDRSVSREIFATTYRLSAPPSPQEVQSVLDQLRVVADVSILGVYVSDPTPNNFPALPIREGEYLLTWFGAGAHSTAPIIPQALARLIMGVPEHLPLTPTSRSALR